MSDAELSPEDPKIITLARSRAGPGGVGRRGGRPGRDRPHLRRRRGGAAVAAAVRAAAGRGHGGLQRRSGLEAAALVSDADELDPATWPWCATSAEVQASTGCSCARARTRSSPAAGESRDPEPRVRSVRATIQPASRSSGPASPASSGGPTSGKSTPDQRPGRDQGGHHQQPAADHPAGHPGHRAPAGRAADPGRHARAAQAAHAARGAAGQPGPLHPDRGRRDRLLRPGRRPDRPGRPVPGPRAGRDPRHPGRGHGDQDRPGHRRSRSPAQLTAVAELGDWADVVPVSAVAATSWTCWPTCWSRICPKACRCTPTAS